MVACIAIALLAPFITAQSAPRWVVGGEDDVATQLGRFRGVEALPSLFVVLERDAPFIKVFDYSGRLVQSVGRAGGGPGEFSAPSSATFDARQQRLLVVDATNARVTEYAVGDTLAYARQLTLEDNGVRSLCILGARLFGLARNSPTIVRELREDPTRLSVIASFGELRTNHQHGGHPFVRSRASDGPMSCDQGGNRIVAASSILGEVQVIDAVTRAQASSPLPGFEGLTITVDDNSMTMTPPEAGFDVVVDLVTWDGMLRAVTERSKPAPGGPPLSLGFATAPITTRGPGPLSARQAWRPLAQTKAGALCSLSDPAPTIALFAGGRCP